MSTWVKRDKKRQYAPEVVVEGLELRKITVERGYVLRTDTADRAYLKNLACRAGEYDANALNEDMDVRAITRSSRFASG